MKTGSILGFHVTSKKAKIKNFEFSSASGVRAGNLKRRLGVDITNILQQHNEFNDNSNVDLYYYLVA